MKPRPSFIASALSGTIIFIAFILFCINFKSISKNPYEFIVILSLNNRLNYHLELGSTISPEVSSS